MPKREHKIFAVFLLLTLLLLGCEMESEQNDIVLLELNGEAIYQSDLDLIKHQYSSKEFDEEDLLESIVMERVVLQCFEVINGKISDNQIDEQFNALKNLDEQGIYYEKALEIYGSDERIREAIRYRLMYNSVKSYVQEEACSKFSANEAIIDIRTDDFISQVELDGYSEEVIREYNKAVNSRYEDALITEMSDLYFKGWIYRMLGISEIAYINYTGSLFDHVDVQLNQRSLLYGEKELELSEITLMEAQEVYGNFLYIGTDKDKEELMIFGLHDPEESLKVLSLNYYDEERYSLIAISVIVTPTLSMKDTCREYINGDTNTVQLRFSDIGVQYSISAKLEFEELEYILHQLIPYQIGE